MKENTNHIHLLPHAFFVHLENMEQKWALLQNQNALIAQLEHFKGIEIA